MEFPIPSSSQLKLGSVFEDVVAAIIPLLKLITLTLFGLVLAHPKVQVIPRATFKLLSKLVFVLFLPCLIFTHLGSSITLELILLWWFIPVNVVISTVIGCVLGCLVALICRPPREFVRFTIIATAFGNTGNIAYSVVTSVCRTTDNPFGTDCETDGVAYVSFAQWVSVILVYTLVYHMMEPPYKYYEIVDEDEEDANTNTEEDSTEDDEIEAVREEVSPVDDMSRPLLHEAEWPMMAEKETEHSKTPFIARLFNSISGSSQISAISVSDLAGHDGREEGNGGPSSPKSIRCLAEPRVVRKIRVVAKQTPIQHVLQPPTIASLLAIVIGVIPAAKSVVYGDDAALEFFTGSLEIMSEAMVPSVMLILGGMLAEGPTASSLGIRTTVGIIVARLLVLPVLGFGVVYLANKWNLLVADDDMYRFVLLMQYATPSAILFGAIASIRGYAVKEASGLLFWQHICAVFSFMLYLIIYFNILIDFL